MTGDQAMQKLIAATRSLDDDAILAALAEPESPGNEPERVLRMAMMEVLEERHDVAAAMDAWASDFENTRSQCEAMVAAVEAQR